MPILQPGSWIFRCLISCFVVSSLAACSGSSGESEPADSGEVNVIDVPLNPITNLSFSDIDGQKRSIGGQLRFEPITESDSNSNKQPIESIVLYWADDLGNKLGESWLDEPMDSTGTITIPSGTLIPEAATGILLYTSNSAGPSKNAIMVTLKDLVAVFEKPIQMITTASFIDQDGALGVISGSVGFELPHIDENDPARIESLVLYWNKNLDMPISEVQLGGESELLKLTIPTGTKIPEGTDGLLIFAVNRIGMSEAGYLLNIEDFVAVLEKPVSQVSGWYFRDRDVDIGQISGQVLSRQLLESTPDTEPLDPARVESTWLYWADAQGQKVGEAWLKTASDAPYNVQVPADTTIPDGINAMLLFANNSVGEADKGSLIQFHDFKGNTLMSGPGGNELQSWSYGEQRSKIAVHRSSQQGGLCSFDNGLVSVIDMNNSLDEDWQAGDGATANAVNDVVYPAYQFFCGESPNHTERPRVDDIGVWTYSTLNDAMFYGTLVYDTFLKYLTEPALEDKLRLRVHYGNHFLDYVYWDGAYANFGEGYPFQYSMLSLDSVAHEIGHGVLNRISGLNGFEYDISVDAKTVHEAFGDISGVMAKYDFGGPGDIWVHGAESDALTRKLDQVITEYGAVSSLLDYDQAGDNYYLRIGLITYPFYLMSNSWGLERTYQLFIGAARNCWQADMDLTMAASCIKQRAAVQGLEEQVVIDAFKAVKLKLFDEGVLSHFKVENFKLNNQFTDNSVSTTEIKSWLWEFGDGHSSNEANPSHRYQQAGTYQVKLTVTDESNSVDSFVRELSVTDVYCPILSSSDDQIYISEVAIGGTNINYASSKTDYSEVVLALNEPNRVNVDVSSSVMNTERSTTWRIWVDLNDNGLFGDTEEELVLDEYSAEGESYSANFTLDLSHLDKSQGPKYMRIAGGYAVIDPCTVRRGRALDVLVDW